MASSQFTTIWTSAKLYIPQKHALQRQHPQDFTSFGMPFTLIRGPWVFSTHQRHGERTEAKVPSISGAGRSTEPPGTGGTAPERKSGRKRARRVPNSLVSNRPHWTPKICLDRHRTGCQCHRTSETTVCSQWGKREKNPQHISHPRRLTSKSIYFSQSENLHVTGHSRDLSQDPPTTPIDRSIFLVSSSSATVLAASAANASCDWNCSEHGERICKKMRDESWNDPVEVWFRGSSRYIPMAPMVGHSPEDELNCEKTSLLTPQNEHNLRSGR